MADLAGPIPDDLIELSPDEWTAPFWFAAAEHRLVIPRCTTCGTYRMPPSAFCWHCRAQGIDWVEHDGRGVIYSFTVARHAIIAEVASAIPYVPAVVELDGLDGVRIIGSVIDIDPDAVRIGLPVELVWHDVRANTTIPCFRITG